MGAITLAEYGTAPGDLVGFFRQVHLACLIQSDRHPAQLLEKEFPGAGGAFIAGVDLVHPAVLIQMVDHGGLTTGTDYHPIGMIRGQEERSRLLHGLGLSNAGEVEHISELSSGGRNPVLLKIFKLPQHLPQHLSWVTVMGPGLSKKKLSFCGVLFKSC